MEDASAKKTCKHARPELELCIVFRMKYISEFQGCRMSAAFMSAFTNRTTVQCAVRSSATETKAKCDVETARANDVMRQKVMAARHLAMASLFSSLPASDNGL